MKFQEKLTNLRKENGLTQEQLAEKLSVSRQAVSRWEAGDSAPDMYNLQAISRCFGVSADFLINDDYTDDEDTPLAQTKNNEIAQVKKSNKHMHLIAGICFVVACVCFGISVCCFAENDTQLIIFAMGCGMTLMSAMIQFVCYFQN